MKKLLLCEVILLSVSRLFAVEVTTIEQVDDLAEFSFSIMSDNRGSVQSDIIGWIQDNDEFCIGNGDLFNGNNDQFDDILENSSHWFHTNFYPVIGDHDNQIVINGVKGTQSAWGRGHVVFDQVADFGGRPNVQFRTPTSSRVLSNGKNYTDRKVDYYATETHGKFTVHIIAIYKGDESVFAQRSADFMMDKIYEISAHKTDYDIVVLLGHDARWFERSVGKQITSAQRDYAMKNVDLIVGASDHIFRRRHQFDGDYDKPALVVNSGATTSTGSTWGYVNVHVFDSPPRFTIQYINRQDFNSRKLHEGVLTHVSSNVDHVDLVKPMMKYVNGDIVQPLDWSNFTAVPPTPDPIINLVENPSFETGGRTPNAWISPAGYTRSTEEATVGDHALKGTGGARIGNASQTIAIKPNTEYQMSVRLKFLAGGTGRMYFDTFDKFDDQGNQFRMAPGNDGWQLFEGSFNSGSQTEVTLRTYTSTDFSGTFYVDDVILHDPTVVPAQPEFETTPATTGAVGSDYKYTVLASDADSASLTYTAPVKPGWLSFEPSTRILSGAPGGGDVGSHNVTLQVSDGGWTIDQNFRIEVSGAGGNFVVNHSFETGDDTGWSKPSGFATIASESAQEGIHAMKYAPFGGTIPPTTQTIPLGANTDYEISVWINYTAGTTGQFVFDTDDVFDGSGQGQFVLNAKTNGWVKYSGSFNSGTESSVTLRMFAVGDGLDGTVYIDNISLIPSTVALYDLWAMEWGSPIGAAIADHDGDLRNNLYEYALNGDPTRAGDRGVPPGFSVEGGELKFSHLRRKGDDNLIYTVQSSRTLADGSWVDAGLGLPETVSIDDDYEELFYVVPVELDAKFYRLLIVSS